MFRRIIGIVILIFIVGLALLFKEGLFPLNFLNFLNSQDLMEQKPVTIINGLTGGGKVGLLEDEEVKRIFEQKYGLKVNYTRAGSLEIVSGDTSKYDVLFPSSQLAFESYKQSHGSRIVKSATIFNTPIVLYSWDTVTEALSKQGIVKKIGDNYFISDFPKLISFVVAGKKWSDIGIPDLYGKITIYSTDPTKSSSGVMFAGLLSNVLNGEIVDENSINKVIPVLRDIYRRVGYMDSSSNDLFEQYLRTGVGGKPIIVGYENYIVEFSLQNPEVWKELKNRVRILYPMPTTWAPHSMIALNAKGVKLITALQDKDVQRIAWKKHGFRTGLIGVENDPDVLKVAGIPKQIDQIVPTPKSQVMEMVVKALKQQ